MKKEIYETQDKVIKMILSGDKDESIKKADRYFDELDPFYLLENQTELFNQQDEHGNTLLHYCSIKNEDYLIDKAIEKGLRVDIKNNYGLTAVDYADLFGYENIVSIATYTKKTN